MMDYASAAGAIIGGGMSLAGAWIGANAASRTKKQLGKIAETPGLDLGQITSDTLGINEKSLPSARRIGGQLTDYEIENLNKSLNAGIPGYEGIQKSRSAQIAQLVRGEIPQDVEDAVLRSSASRALGGGYAGTGVYRNLVARDLGRTSLGLIEQGNKMAGDYIAGTPYAKVAPIDQFLGLSTAQTTNVRAAERSEKMRYQVMAALAPGKSAVWSKWLQDTGNSIGGMGMGGLMGGGGGATGGAK